MAEPDNEATASNQQNDGNETPSDTSDAEGLGLFRKKEERKPATFPERIINLAKNNYRGLLSFLLCIIILVLLFDRYQRDRTVAALWIMLVVLFFFTPMPIGAACLLPVFGMPCIGVMSSNTVSSFLINENILLFFIGGWLLFLMSNCDLDKRLACYFLASGNKTAYTPKKLLLKSCVAAFISSALGDRDLCTPTVINVVFGGLQPVLTVKGEANYGGFKTVLTNAVGVSSAIGSLCIVNTALTTLQMRAVFYSSVYPKKEYPEIFNFLNYSAYAVPVALVMFILNTGYEILLLSRIIGAKPMTVRSQELVQKAYKKQQQDLGPMSNHQKLTIFFMVLIFVCYFTRWSKWLGMGWATFRQYEGKEICGIKDATTAAVYAILLHFLPKSLHFLKIFSVKKQRDIPQMKVESGILFWRFIDKNSDYSLFFVLGAGSILYNASLITGLHDDIKEQLGNSITGLDWNVAILIIVLVSIIGACLMPGLGSQAVIMPLMLAISATGPNKWPTRSYLVALAVGLGSNLGFCSPFVHTPAYYVRSVGKVERLKQIKYSLASIIICGVILWLSLCFYAPILWDPSDEGFAPQTRPGVNATTTVEVTTEA